MRRLVFTIFLTFILGLSVFSQNSLPNIIITNKWYELGVQKDTFINATIELDNTKWAYSSFGTLIFSEGYYVYGTPWSGIESYGKYSTKNNKVTFSPALILPRWDEKYTVNELLITTSSRKDGEGKQVLFDCNATISLYGYEYPSKSSTTEINDIVCN